MVPSCAVVLFWTLLMSAVWLECCGHEFTFELPDNEKMCFYEVLKKDVKCTLEFQVSCERMLILPAVGRLIVLRSVKIHGTQSSVCATQRENFHATQPANFVTFRENLRNAVHCLQYEA